jgi:hypothetical protein
MAPIKGEWIFNCFKGYIYEGYFDHDLGYANLKELR